VKGSCPIGALGAALMGSNVLELRDQIGVGVRHRRGTDDELAAAQAKDGTLGTDDVNVLDLGAVEERLQPPKPPDQVLDLLGDRDFG
jgi:hypothetical protein